LPFISRSSDFLSKLTLALSACLSANIWNTYRCGPWDGGGSGPPWAALPNNHFAKRNCGGIEPFNSPAANLPTCGEMPVANRCKHSRHNNLYKLLRGMRNNRARCAMSRRSDRLNRSTDAWRRSAESIQSQSRTLTSSACPIRAARERSASGFSAWLVIANWAVVSRSAGVNAATMLCG
jgi:hypothetical protein